MSHPLRQKLALLRTRLRRMLAVHGVCCVVVAVTTAAISLGLTDYLLRIQDFGVRLILSIVFAAVAGWAVWQYLVRPLSADWRDVDLARRVEEWQPSLGDRLRTSVEFLRQAEDDPLAGSPALRRAAINQTMTDTDGLDFAAVLDVRPILHAVMAAAAVCLVAAIFVVIDPHVAALAVKRLVLPFGAASWPRETQLVLRREVTRVARGQAFELEVAAAEGSQLPSEVRVHYRWQIDDVEANEEVERLPAMGQTVVVRRENITRPFAYRVEGGDDQSMPWIEVALVEPPEIAASEIRIFPPAYSGFRDQKADGQIRALVGSRLAVKASANKPLRSAALCLSGNHRFPATISDDGLRLEISADSEPAVLVEKSGPYWFELIDRDGLFSPAVNRGEITAVPDGPPTVVIQQPAANLFVTPEASIPLRAVAKDDLAVRRAALSFSRSDRPEQGEFVIPLYEGPDRAEPRSEAGLPSDGGRELMLEHAWNLAELGLTPGSQVTLQVVAEDYRGQTGKSEPRRLSMITPRELKDRLGARQATLLAELDRILQMQRANRGGLSAIEAELDASRQLDEGAIHRMQAVEMNQRQVDRVLTSRSDGLPSHILAILEDMRNNNAESDDVQRRMQWLLAEIARIERQCLTENGRLLTGAIKAAQVQWQDAAGPVVPARAVQESIAAAGKVQDAIVASLEQMRSRLAEGDSFRRFDRELAQLAREQDDLAKHTADAGRRTLTRPWKDLLPADVGELKVLAGRQSDLARRVDRLLQEMAQASTELRQSDPLAADTLSDACDEAARLGVAAQMRKCGLAVQENQIGLAMALEKEIAEAMQDVLNILANQRQHELARLVKSLQESEAELTAIQRRQGELATRWMNADRQAAAQQTVLEDETRRLARRLERLTAEKAGQAAVQAADAMRSLQDAAGKGNTAHATEEAKRAEKSLDEAREQLVAHRLRKQAELAMEQLAKLEDSLKHVRTQQDNTLKETQRFAVLASEGTLTRGQAAGLSDLARRQAALKADIQSLTERLDGAKGFLLALRGVAAPMGEAASRLVRRDTGPQTQQAESLAIARIDLLLKALEPESPEEDGQGPDGLGGNTAGQGGQPGGVQALAELKLIRLMQVELNERTQHLQEAISATAKPSEEQLRVFRSLSQEQARLAEIVLDLLAPSGEKQEKLP